MAKKQRDKLGRLLPGACPPEGAHWPKGKRRNEDSGEWSATRLSIVTLLSDHYLVGERTSRALAIAVGVDPHTMVKWLDGTNRPAPAKQLALKGWLLEQRKAIKTA